ncbi:hypothetical protein [Actinoplanes sp. NBRC 103695]|uniref:hypothetical protein n=1 Tax=Actinoplanes sp. NBRC 103695 TaxID=3032202 RepID=UPI0024A37D98|nr:hypothetical protein [Actinoplanes sp. NBRC 103695]GLY98056.1 hypothetical protein Acsp02_53100 [Actinoplanes sp. NBRC 103695]
MLVELSHVIEAGMVTYPGLPGPEISEHLTREASRGAYAPGTEFTIGRIPIVEHLTNLAALPLTGARFTAAPPRVAGFGTFPVRAFAVIDS